MENNIGIAGDKFISTLRVLDIILKEAQKNQKNDVLYPAKSVVDLAELIQLALTIDLTKLAKELTSQNLDNQTILSTFATEYHV